jgi:N-methylhydantoinase A
MVRAIEEITVYQGIDPRQAAMVAGGGAAGLNAALIARRLGCRFTILPQFASALSATGGLIADVSRDFSASFVSSTADFKYDEINRTLQQLQNEAETFLHHLPGTQSVGRIEYHAEARYPYQVWELDVPLNTGAFATEADVSTLEGDFHRLHEEMFGFRDASQPVEVISWRVRATAEVPTPRLMGFSPEASPVSAPTERSAYFAGCGRVMARVVHKLDLRPGASYEGPAIVELPTTTIVVPPDAVLSVMESGDVAIEAIGDHRIQPSNPTGDYAA